MFNNTPEQTDLSQAIDSLYQFLDAEPRHSAEYAAIADQIVKLESLKSNVTESGISKDALLAAGVNLFGIIAILHYERFGIITSKALSFAMKFK